MGVCNSAGANLGKTVSLGSMGSASWSECPPPPAHPTSRASSVCMLEKGQNAAETWISMAQQWLKGMQLLGWAPCPRTILFPSSLGVPGVPRMSISEATHGKWEPSWPVGSTRAAGRRCRTHCQVRRSSGVIPGEAPGCGAVGIPAVRGRTHCNCS